MYLKFKMQTETYIASVQVNSEGSHQAKVMIVDIANPGDIIRVFIPKLSASDSDPLSAVSSENALNQKLVPLILAKFLELLLNLISYFFRKQLQLLCGLLFSL